MTRRNETGHGEHRRRDDGPARPPGKLRPPAGRRRCKIAGVTDLKRELAEAVADRYRVPRVYENVDELLADPEVDGVTCIQQWPNNFQLVHQTLSAGKSVITEKPMVGRLDEAEELTALAKKNGVHYAVGFMKRYDTGVELAKASSTSTGRAVSSASAGGGLRLQRRRLAAKRRGADPGRGCDAAAAAAADLSRCLPNRSNGSRLRLASQYLFAHSQLVPPSFLRNEMTPADCRVPRARKHLRAPSLRRAMVTVRGAMPGRTSGGSGRP